MWAYVYKWPKILPFYGFLLFVLHLPFFIIFRLFPSMALIENISFAENIFHLKNFGTWLPMAMRVAGVHGSISVRIRAYALVYWSAWCVHVPFFHVSVLHFLCRSSTRAHLSPNFRVCGHIMGSVRY